MKRVRTAFLITAGVRLAALGVAAIGVVGSSRAQDPAPAAETTPALNTPPKGGMTVGVVDFVKVLAAYPRAIQERKKIDEFTKQRRALLDAEEKKAQEIKLKRDDLQPGTMERDLKEHELRLKVQDLDGMRQVFENERRRMVEEFYVVIHEDMQRAVKKVAEDRGIALVLRVHEDLFDGSIDLKSRVFELRVVWYAAEEIDLTSAVIQRLQTQPQSEPDKGPAAPKDAPKDPPTAKETTGGKPGD